MQIPLPFWNFLIFPRCHSARSCAILIKRWKWGLSIFSISTFAASIKLLLGFMSACYPERRRKPSLDGSAELCYCTFSTAVYGCNNKANFMTRGNGNSEREKNKVSINIQRKVSSGGGFYGTKQSLRAKYGEKDATRQRSLNNSGKLIRPPSLTVKADFLEALNRQQCLQCLTTRAWRAVHECLIHHNDRNIGAEQSQSERYGCFLKAFTVGQLQLTLRLLM